MPTFQESAYTLTDEAGNRLEVWLGPARGTLDEGAITTAWLPPSPGQGWTDRSDDIALDAGVSVTWKQTGAVVAGEAEFAVADESRPVWADDLAVAFVARHWDGGAWGPRYLAVWGYLTGEGAQRRTTADAGGDQTGRRKITYAGYWDRLRVPATRYGRANLAQGAQIGPHTAELANPLAEAPLEYVSQADVAPARAIDQNSDTVYVADAFADPAIPDLGDTATPKIVRVYAGRATRQIGDGGEPIFIEVGCGHNLTPWGNMEGGAGSIPGAAFPGGAFVGNHGLAGDVTLVAGAGFDGSTALRFRAPANPNISAGTGWQWELFDGGSTKRPIRLRYRIKASGAGDVGRQVHFRANPHYQDGGQPQDYLISLPADWQTFEHDWDSSGNHGGLVFGWKADFFTLSSDLSWDIDDVRMSVGYSSNAAGTNVWIAADDGAGHEQWWGLAGLFGTGTDFRVPADDTVLICDDVGVLKGKFGDTGRAVAALQNVMPWFFLGPGVGRVKLVSGVAPANFLDYDSTAGGQAILDEFTGAQYTGAAGANAMKRDAPLLTGGFIQESPPQVGLRAGIFGSAYVCIDLGAYQAPHLTDAIDAAATRIPVSDLDQYAHDGYVLIGAEWVWYSGKDNAGLVAIRRGFNSTVAAAHSVGDLVTPGYDGNAAPGTAAQTGPLWDYLEIRRKPGTPRILAGAVLWSNLAAPGDPAAGGALWEQHPDWHLLGRWSWDGMPAVIGLAPAWAPVFGGSAAVRQARWVCVVIDRMERYKGSPQRGKVNEVIVRQYVPAAGQAGQYLGHGAGDTAGVIGHVLTQHAGLPVGKFAVSAPTPPINDLPVQATTVAQALGTLAGNAVLALWLDPANAATLQPDPANPEYDGRTVAWTWDESGAVGELAGDWTAAHRVAQVTATGIEAAGLRVLTAAYPPHAGEVGEVRDLRDVPARSAAELAAICRAAFRAGNARRSFPVKCGAAPWLRPYQRHVVNFPDLDAGGQQIGVNAYVAGWQIAIGEDGAGGVDWQTQVDLRELAL